MKNVLRIHRQPEGHWVGDGFPVHTVLDYQRHPELSPFLLLDHAGPADFAPADKPRGVGWHPHRGFETVTLVSKARSTTRTPPATAAASARAKCNG